MRKIEVRAAIRALAEVKRGDLNPTSSRGNPAFSGTATVKDRRRPPRIVPDRHNLAGADEAMDPELRQRAAYRELRPGPQAGSPPPSGRCQPHQLCRFLSQWPAAPGQEVQRGHNERIRVSEMLAGRPVQLIEFPFLG
jgi:hypothetical protein